MNLTHDQVDALTEHLCSKYSVAALELGPGTLVKALLDLAGVGDFFRPDLVAAADGLLPIAGLSLGPIVLVRGGLPPGIRARVVVHEVSHSLHVREEGLLRYCALYVDVQEFRTSAEAGAYCAEAELGHFLDGTVPAPGALVRIDHGYLLKSEQVTFGGLLGEQAAVAIERGIYTQPVAREAIAWLKARP